MFDPELEKEHRYEAQVSRRRIFLASGASALAGLLLWSRRKPWSLEANASTGAAEKVTIVEFSDAGQRLNTVQVAKVVKTDDEWRKQLSPGVYSITRQADTEFAFSGEYLNNHDNGLYRCICCANALFSSETKFESGTGWPSFWAPLAKENVRKIRDTSFGEVRTAVSCTECDAHLGHVFDDGPDPSGLRYCMNSASLKFIPTQSHPKT
jgi:peptide-methionine (R)-S-oxide reductase